MIVIQGWLRGDQQEVVMRVQVRGGVDLLGGMDKGGERFELYMVYVYGNGNGI